MELSHVVSEYLEPERIVPAVGQGALGIETRTGDGFTNEMVASLAHQATMTIVSAERAFLKRLEGGCQVPIGAYATMEGETLVLTGMVADLDGVRLIRKDLHGDAQQPEVVGERLAEVILESGGAEILSEIYSSQ
jgi:hydroxymethylbilane synthase